MNRRCFIKRSEAFELFSLLPKTMYLQGKRMPSHNWQGHDFGLPSTISNRVERSHFLLMVMKNCYFQGQNSIFSFIHKLFFTGYYRYNILAGNINLNEDCNGATSQIPLSSWFIRRTIFQQVLSVKIVPWYLNLPIGQIFKLKTS